MSEEITSQEQSPVTNLIPDEILQEIEKVSKLENSLRLLNQRQANVEKSITVLKESSNDNDGGELDEDDVISDKEDAKPKKDKNVVSKDKLKGYLDTVEKKRYENIGVEFAKGAEKIFSEIKKAQELKEKMSTKKSQDVIKDVDSGDEKDGDKKKISFLKLGLAITAVAGILYMFRDKINDIIPGFKSGAEKIFSPIKSIGDRLFGSLFSNISDMLQVAFDDIFTGPDGIKSAFNIFFLDVLPEVIYQSGLALFQAFGAEVDSTVREFSDHSVEMADNALEDGKAAEEAANEQMLQDIANRRSARQSIMSSEGELAKSKRFIATDALVSAQMTESVAEMMNISKDTFRQYAQHGDAFMRFFQNEMASRDMSRVTSVMNDVEMAERFYQQYVGGETKTEEGKKKFNEWKENTWNKNMSDSNWSKITAAVSEYQRGSQQIAKTNADRQIYEEQNKRLTEGLLQKEKEQMLGDADPAIKIQNIELELSQNAFVAEVESLCSTIKNAFSFTDKNSNILKDLVDTATGFIKSIIEDLIKPLTNYIGQLIPLTKNVQLDEKKQSKSGQSDSSFTSLSLSGVGSKISQMSNSGPVLLFDLDLNGQALAAVHEVFKEETELLVTMKNTNEKLKQIQSLTIQKKSAAPQNATNINNENNNVEDKKNYVTNDKGEKIQTDLGAGIFSNLNSMIKTIDTRVGVVEGQVNKIQSHLQDTVKEMTPDTVSQVNM